MKLIRAPRNALTHASKRIPSQGRCPPEAGFASDGSTPHTRRDQLIDVQRIGLGDFAWIASLMSSSLLPHSENTLGIAPGDDTDWTSRGSGRNLGNPL